MGLNLRVEDDYVFVKHTEHIGSISQSRKFPEHVRVFGIGKFSGGGTKKEFLPCKKVCISFLVGGDLALMGGLGFQ